MVFLTIRKILFRVGLIALVGAAFGCARNKADQQRKEAISERAIEEVLRQRTDEWMSIPGVVGTAIGKLEGKKVIKVLVIEKAAQIENKIPRTVEGYRVILEEVGEIRAQESESE